MPATPLDVLAEELGAVAGRIEREARLRTDALLADMAKRDAERDLRLDRLERELSDRIASLKDGAPGEPGQSITVEDVRPLIVEVVDALPKAEKEVSTDLIEQMVAEAIAKIPPPAPGESVTIDDVAPIIVAEVERRIASLPLPEPEANPFAPDDVGGIVAAALRMVAEYVRPACPEEDVEERRGMPPAIAPVTVNLPPITIRMPEQPAPVVNVAPAAVTVEPAAINIEMPRGGKEVTTVREWTPDGRIKAFEKTYQGE